MEGYFCDDDGMVRFMKKIVVPKKYLLRDLIMKESHRSLYMSHPGVQKMSTNLKKKLFWNGIRKDIGLFVERCIEFQLVKAEHGHPTRLFQSHNIPKSKWEETSIDFIVELPETVKRHNSIFVVVDKLTKSAHFTTIRDTYKSLEIAQVFVKDIVRLCGFPKKII
jgi:hypothetical protein